MVIVLLDHLEPDATLQNPRQHRYPSDKLKNGAIFKIVSLKLSKNRTFVHRMTSGKALIEASFWQAIRADSSHSHQLNEKKIFYENAPPKKCRLKTYLVPKGLNDVMYEHVLTGKVVFT